MPTFDFERIRNDIDRSYTFALIDQIKHGYLDDLDEIIKTLEELGDPRSEDRLLSLILDGQLAESIRRAASDALGVCNTHDTIDERQLWWQSGDPILMRHAVRMAERTEEHLIESIATNPAHAFYEDAIYKLQSWEESRFQDLIIRALDHPQSSVRTTAAYGLLWEQPVKAERRLLEIASEEDDEASHGST